MWSVPSRRRLPSTASAIQRRDPPRRSTEPISPPNLVAITAASRQLSHPCLLSGSSCAHIEPRLPLRRSAGTAGHPCYPRSMPDTAAPLEPVVAARPVVVERAVVSVRTLVVAALIVSALLGLAVLLSQVVNLLLILLVAIVFAEGMRPLVNRLTEARLPRPLAITVVYAAFIALLAVLITLLVQPIVDEATSLAHNLPSYQKSIESTVASWQHALNLGGSGSPNIGNTLAGSLDTAKNVLLTIGGYIVGVLVNLVLVP